MIVASASGKGWGGGWQSMNGTKGEGEQVRKWSKLGKWMREKEREGSYKRL